MKYQDIESGTTLKKGKDETRPCFLERINHISINSKNISSMDGIEVCKNLVILDLSENLLNNISHLEYCKNLRKLYLQNNRIKTIAGLDDLPLEILNLSCNEICHVSGLEKLQNLEILTLDQQNIKDPMSFDPNGSLKSLKHLSLIQCHIINVEQLSIFPELQSLNLSNNAIDSFDQLEYVVSRCKRLKELLVFNNPVTSNIRLFERLVAYSDSLETLNDKRITQNSRIFIRNKMKIKKTTKIKRNSERDGRQSPKPVPHLPPYATQYRDLLISQMEKSAASAAESNGIAFRGN